MAKRVKKYAEEGNRLRLLRQAERVPTSYEWAIRLGWQQSALSQFETGDRRMPLEKALELRRLIPGFDPLWLWEGDKRGLSFDLRSRIEAQEEIEKSHRLGRKT